VKRAEGRAEQVSGTAPSESTPRRQQEAPRPAIQLLAHERHHHEVRPHVGPRSEVALGYDASISASSLVKRSYVTHRNALKQPHYPPYIAENSERTTDITIARCRVSPTPSRTGSRSLLVCLALD